MGPVPTALKDKPWSELGLGLLAWYQRDPQPLPWRILWAETRNPFAVWVSEIMLQQTTIAAVWPKYQSFMERFPTVEDFAAAPLEEALLSCRGLGYYRRFRMLHQAARELVNGSFAFQAEAYLSRNAQGVIWPSNDLDWLQLPGVGAYTAAAIASITRETMVPVVDGNVERVMQRVLGETFSGTAGRLKAYLRPLLEKMLCAPPGDFNQGMMELGQKVCTKTAPQCTACPLRTGCLSFTKGIQSTIPAAKVKPQPLAVALNMVIEANGTHVSLHPRGASYRFLPNTVGFHYDEAATPPKARFLGRFKHAITQHRIIVSVYQEDLKGSGLPQSEVEKALVSNLDRKALQLYLRGNKESASLS